MFVLGDIYMMRRVTQMTQSQSYIQIYMIQLYKIKFIDYKKTKNICEIEFQQIA